MNLTCRLCLTNEGKIQDIFTFDGINLPQKIFECTNIIIKKNQYLPSGICDICKTEIITWCKLKRQVINSNELLRTKYPSEFIEGTDLYNEKATQTDCVIRKNQSCGSDSLFSQFSPSVSNLSTILNSSIINNNTNTINNLEKFFNIFEHIKINPKLNDQLILELNLKTSESQSENFNLNNKCSSNESKLQSYKIKFEDPFNIKIIEDNNAKNNNNNDIVKNLNSQNSNDEINSSIMMSTGNNNNVTTTSSCNTNVNAIGSIIINDCNNCNYEQNNNSKLYFNKIENNNCNNNGQTIIENHPLESSSNNNNYNKNIFLKENNTENMDFIGSTKELNFDNSISNNSLNINDEKFIDHDHILLKEKDSDNESRCSISSKYDTEVFKTFRGNRVIYSYKCNVCGQLQTNIKQHMLVHTNELPYKCTFNDCDKRFRQKQNLKRHINMHTGTKPYKCKMKNCERKFTDSAALRSHMILHTGDRNYQCDICKRAFGWGHTLAQHRKIHEVNRQRSYSCDYCNRQFFAKNNLLKHMRLFHSTENNLNTNCNNNINIMNDNNNVKEIIDSTSLTSSSRIFFECNYCQAKFRYSSVLKAHIEKDHLRFELNTTENTTTTSDFMIKNSIIDEETSIESSKEFEETSSSLENMQDESLENFLMSF